LSLRLKENVAMGGGRRPCDPFLENRVRKTECGILQIRFLVHLKKHFCFAKSASLVLQELRLTILLAHHAGDSSVGLRLPLRMTASHCFFEFGFLFARNL